MDCEGAIIISCDILSSEDIIRKILDVESLPESVTSNHAVKGYPWNIKNKYYSAKVNLFALEEKTELDSTFCDSIKAIIFYFDSEKKSSFDDVMSWMPFLEDIDAEVKILLCNNCLEENNDPAVLERKNILKWCIENHFELVELNPEPESDDNEELCKDSKGYGRVNEALQTYHWANIGLEEEKPKSNEEKIVENSTPKNEGIKTIQVEDQKLDLEEKWLNDVLGVEDPGEESFEALFAKFVSMKERASGLSGEERKKYAEKVAISFWKAVGGDEDEIAGLDSDE